MGKSKDLTIFPRRILVLVYISLAYFSDIEVRLEDTHLLCTLVPSVDIPIIDDAPTARSKISSFIIGIAF